jgi:hypothetical protein
MTLSDLASIGGFVSSIAVVITLIFLLWQLRQTNRNQRSLMQQGRSARSVDLLLRAAEPHLSEILSRAFSNDISMDETQVRSFQMFSLASLTSWEDSFLQHQAGTLDDASFTADAAVLRIWARSPAFRAFWLMMRDIFSGDYRAYVDNLIRDTKAVREPYSGAATWKEFLKKELEDAE